MHLTRSAAPSALLLSAVCLFLLLPRWNHPLFESALFRKSSDDGFILVIESRDPKFRKEKTREFLEEIGADEIELLEV